MSSPDPIAVLGLGAWGNALAGILKQQGYSVLGWQRSQGPLEELPLESCVVILCALPIKSIRGVAEQVARRVTQSAVTMRPIVLSATKGLEPETAQTAAEIWRLALPQVPVTVLSGPNLSVEIEQHLPAATVVAGDESATQKIQQMLSTSWFRVYTNPDLRGVELGGILKNVIAIACGASDGLSLGVNARSALITRGLLEMVRVGTHWGGQLNTFYGLSGLGDLLATCTSPLSRNYQVGWRLAQGQSLEQALAEVVGTAEGVNTAMVLAHYARQKELDVPITEEVCAVLEGLRSPTAAIANLLDRPSKPELTLPS
jgi:glycerol-3-phosphate dehydrogenase (NAD(P)+)